MPSTRIPANIIANDREILEAIQDLLDYTPRNPECSIPALLELEAALTQAEQAEGRARRAYEQARTHAAMISRQLHNTVIRAKSEIITQYGADSEAVKNVGLKRKSDRKRPVRRAEGVDLMA